MTHINIIFRFSEEASEHYTNLSPQNTAFISIILLSTSMCCSRHEQNHITSPVWNRLIVTDLIVCGVSSGKSANWSSLTKVYFWKSNMICLRTCHEPAQETSQMVISGVFIVLFQDLDIFFRFLLFLPFQQKPHEFLTGVMAPKLSQVAHFCKCCQKKKKKKVLTCQYSAWNLCTYNMWSSNKCVPTYIIHSLHRICWLWLFSTFSHKTR